MKETIAYHNNNYKLSNHGNNLLSVGELDAEIDSMIETAKIKRNNNGFFTLAKNIENVSLIAATNVAYQWRAFTRHFVFTVLSGIGIFADNIRRFNDKSDVLLGVLQTSVNIISDDLNNVDESFQKIAPRGPVGIHYRWWEESILYPLMSLCNNNKFTEKFTINPETKTLLDNMTKLSNNYFGAAVQLRIVEAIAFDIALAFRDIYPKLEFNGKKVFKKRHDLEWIYTHIKAEVIHHKQVIDHNDGVTKIAISKHDQREFLHLNKELISSWAEFFSGLERNLKNK